MICRKISGIALSGLTLALSLSATAQDTTTTTDSMTTTGSTAPATMSMEPMQVTGTVTRYYTDRSGYVTAMDVQTAEGTRMVRFSPGMAQRLYSTYPVGGQVTGTVQPSMSMGSTRYDLVAVGDAMPAAGMAKPYMVSDVETLRAAPFIMAGSKLTQFRGKLNRVITDDTGEVLALVLSTSAPASASTDASMMASDSNTMTTGTTMDSGMASMSPAMTIVRVPVESRHPSGAQYAGSDRVSPLFKGAEVEVVGYEEAPRYGVVSLYNKAVSANALVINGRAVGAIGIPRIMDRQSSLLSLNIGGSKSAEEMSAASLGYSSYGVTATPDMTATSDTSMTTGTGS